ncbi:MAG: hydrolase [Herbinix sp.]|nr:hydrolase [Herbinix sp.]
MELWDLYDINRTKLNKTMFRGDPFEQDTYHLVVHVCIFNSKDETNMWDITVGGSATKGDTSQTAAERELFEEIGLRLNLQALRPHITINFKNGFNDIYLVDKDVDMKDLTLQYEEVQSVKWASNEEILSMIKTGEFIPYFPSLISLLFEMRKQYGCIQEN